MTNKMEQYHKCESCNYYNGINRCLLKYILTTDQNTCNKWESRLLNSDDDELGKQDCPYPNNCPHPYGTYETCLKCKANSDNKSVATSSKNTETQGNDRWLLHFGQNMAIPSAQPCDDAISRQALQEWIKDKSFGDIVVASEHNFDCLPSVKPQPKTGHWIEVQESIGINRYKCDQCGDYNRSETFYCPSCGAKMD